MKKFVLLALLSSCVAADAKAPLPTYQAVSQLGEDSFASGTLGTFVNAKGVNMAPADTAHLQFRDHAIRGEKIWLMSAGTGSNSRIYHSQDGGKTWQLQLSAEDHAFFDCLVFTSDKEGWLYGDSHNGELDVRHTRDGGKNWRRLTLPFQARPDEGGFASSGTCINTDGKGNIAIATGNTLKPRILLYRGGQWDAIDIPMQGGNANGAFSVQFYQSDLYVFGGGLSEPQPQAYAARLALDTLSWHELPILPFKGAVYGSAIDQDGTLYVTAPKGLFAWRQNDRGWVKLRDGSFWAADCDRQRCTFAGKHGLWIRRDSDTGVLHNLFWPDDSNGPTHRN